jgi:hypothetical protein
VSAEYVDDGSGRARGTLTVSRQIPDRFGVESVAIRLIERGPSVASTIADRLSLLGGRYPLYRGYQLAESNGGIFRTSAPSPVARFRSLSSTSVETRNTTVV